MQWDKAKSIILENEEVRAELKKNETEYKIIEAIILARKEQNLTQKDLADLIGTKQSNISKLENGNYHPSIEFLNRIALAVGKELQISIV
ncbi:MAG: helix-turn-helix domain-containing protein [Candidatus Cloacimonetes bacterium]|nr:helix-turn-helix domain-containing protein [Candidatus Cloacimonadota bacterium]